MVRVAVGMVVAFLLGGCASSQTTSARLAKRATKAAILTTVKVGATNPDVLARRTQLLRKAGATAAVVELENRGATAQVGVPIQIVAKDRKGAATYRNDLAGLQPSLQQLSYVPRGKAFWIDDQLTGATPAKSLSVRVGRSKGGVAQARVPRITLERTQVETDASGTFIKGIVRNRSALPQVAMPIYGLVRKRGRIVAAGRALLDRLAPDPTPKPVVFRILLVGDDPRGGSFELFPSPTVFSPEGAKSP